MVLFLLKTDTTIDKILIQNGADVSNIVERAKAKNIRIQYVNKEAMNDQSVTKKHQGVIAFSTDFKYSDLEDILKYAKERKEELLKDIVKSSSNAIECFLTYGISEAQNKFNGTIK